MVAIKKTRSRDELRWQAEDDARVMATYQEILGDKTRMNRAIKVAKSQAADLTKRANALQNVAKTKSSSKRKQLMCGQECKTVQKIQMDYIQASSLRELLNKVNSHNNEYPECAILKEDIVEILKEEETFIMLYYR